jgi:dTMP kinase
MTARSGRFIVLEGPDKSGKSTQAHLLVRALADHGLKPVHTREPGGTSFAEAVRSVVLDPKHRVDPLAELMLYEAARAQHTAEVLLPALHEGRTIICERYTLATLAYQGHARGMDLKLVHQLNKIATGGLTADITLVLDIPDSQFEERDPNRELDRLEKESQTFRRKVRHAYRELAASEPHVERIDANRDRHPVHVDIVAHVSQLVHGTLKPVPLGMLTETPS